MAVAVLVIIEFVVDTVVVVAYAIAVIATVEVVVVFLRSIKSLCGCCCKSCYCRH